MTVENNRIAEPRLNYVSCLSPAGLHRMAYWEWGDPDNDRVLLCVHGLTRTGRDFDEVARRLCREYRVVCPDVVGRGRSDWLSEPAYYIVPQYVADMVTLLARLNARVLHWFGTSMGGMIGMTLAGLPGASQATDPGEGGATPDTLLTTPISRLILNDIGPAIEPSALARIGEYVSDPVDFASFDEAVDYIRTVSASFGQHTEEQWRHLTQYVVRQEGERWRKHYDPGLAAPFANSTPAAASAGEAILWRSFDSIACPTLIVRGGDSDLLSAQTAQTMLARNRAARLVEIPGVGHAPSFLTEEQVDIAAEFLLAR